MKLDKMCEGCNKTKEDECSVYTAPPSAYVRAGVCPFNCKEEVVTKSRVRVGQQKQRKRF